MNVREELHKLVDGLNASDAKQRLHLLINEIDEETARQILARAAAIRRRRSDRLDWVT